MNICVYCSSRNKGSAPYVAAAAELGDWIAKQGHTLVYGGATGGLMDAVADAAYAANGKIIGVIPTLIKDFGRLSNVCSQLIEVKDMSERKNVMQEVSDIFIVLPGGIGTMDELFDTISKVALGYFSKPTIIANFNNYWEHLINQLTLMQDTKLGSINNILRIANNLDTLKQNIIKI